MRGQWEIISLDCETVMILKRIMQERTNAQLLTLFLALAFLSLTNLDDFVF